MKLVSKGDACFMILILLMVYMVVVSVYVTLHT